MTGDEAYQRGLVDEAQGRVPLTDVLLAVEPSGHLAANYEEGRLVFRNLQRDEAVDKAA